MQRSKNLLGLEKAGKDVALGKINRGIHVQGGNDQSYFLAKINAGES